MTLNTNYCEFESVGKKASFPVTTVTSIEPGKGVKMDTSGGIVITDTVTKTFAIAMETPNAAGDIINVAYDGIIRVKNSGASTYDHIANGTYDGGTDVYMDSTGHWDDTDPTASAVTGVVLEKIAGSAGVTAFDLRIKFKCNSPTA